MEGEWLIIVKKRLAKSLESANEHVNPELAFMKTNEIS